jgi:phospholipid-translocating ATPase
VLLCTTEEEGTCFVRTDQLDGETDWKLKVAVSDTQSLGEKGVGGLEGSCFGGSSHGRAELAADTPIKDIHTFYGVLNIRSLEPGPSADNAIPLNVENVLWANTVLAAGSAVGLVVYTGKETRAVLNTSEPETKMGTLEREVNRMAKVGYVVIQLKVDPMHRYFWAISVFGCARWIQRTVVYLCLPVSHPLFFDHSDQVSSPMY